MSPCRFAPPLAMALTLALAIAGGPLDASAATKSACALLTAEEIAKAVGHPVTVDPDQSGKDPSGADHCAWGEDGDTAIELSLEPPTTEPARAAGAYREARDDAFGVGAAPVPVAGLGEEALYRDFDGANGGAIVVRKGLVVLGLSGAQTKDAVVGLARLAAGRL